jgi:hypothetical protein
MVSMDSFSVDSVYWQKPESKSFTGSFDWFRSDQWKARYLIMGYLSFHGSDLSQSGLFVKLFYSNFCPNIPFLAMQYIKPIKTVVRFQDGVLSALIGYLGFHWLDLDQSGLFLKLLNSSFCPNISALAMLYIKTIKAEPRYQDGIFMLPLV